MKLTQTLILCTTLLGSAAVSKAADRKPFGNGTLPEVLKPYDVDKNGKLSVEERQAYEKAMREAAKDKAKEKKLLWDTDGDGKISDAERAAAIEAMRKKIEAERAKRFDELDTNDDGKLSAAEFVRVPNLKEEIATRILAHLDTNKDGFVTGDELKCLNKLWKFYVTK
jgi:Ca2+-binding EF-hand superfamily protein